MLSGGRAIAMEPPDGPWLRMDGGRPIGMDVYLGDV